MIKNLEITVMLLAYNEAENIKQLVPDIKNMLSSLGISYEILIIDGASKDDTVKIAGDLGARVLVQKKPGYGEAFKMAISEAAGEYIINIDADCSHNPKFISSLWEKRGDRRLVIASRYLESGRSKTSIFRQLLSIVLNKVYSILLSLPFKDLSSGYRLYYAKDVKALIPSLEAKDFDILLEALMKLYKNGTHVVEVPFCYEPRQHGHSHVRMIKFGISYFKTLVKAMAWRRA